MKTNTHRHGFHRLVALLLCAVCVLGLLPAQAFAMSPGETASSWLGDYYKGSDALTPHISFYKRMPFH